MAALMMMMRSTAVRTDELAHQDFFVEQVSLERRFSCAVVCPLCRMSTLSPTHSMMLVHYATSCIEYSNSCGYHELTGGMDDR
jgi:hypothetical protein